MIRLYRWHVDKFFRSEEIDNIETLSDISIPLDGKKKPITLNSDRITTSKSDIQIKKNTQFTIGYHAVQRKMYLIINNASERKINKEMIFAELKGYYNENLPIIVNLAEAGRMQYFGNIISQALSTVAYLNINQISTDSLRFEIEIGNMWESEFELPIDELFELIEVIDEEKIPKEERIGITYHPEIGQRVISTDDE